VVIRTLSGKMYILDDVEILSLGKTEQAEQEEENRVRHVGAVAALSAG